jgi:hypothetical protein
MCGMRETDGLTLAQVFLRYFARGAFRLLREVFQLPIVVPWQATKTTSASVPGRSVIAVVDERLRAGSAGCAVARPAFSARSIRPYAGRAAPPTAWSGPGREAAGSMRGDGALQRL